LPPGIPGIGEDIDAAMQHAPHPVLHSIFCFFNNIRFYLVMNKQDEINEFDPAHLLPLWGNPEPVGR